MKQEKLESTDMKPRLEGLGLAISHLWFSRYEIIFMQRKKAIMIKSSLGMTKSEEALLRRTTIFITVVPQ